MPRDEMAAQYCLILMAPSLLLTDPFGTVHIDSVHRCATVEPHPKPQDYIHPSPPKWSGIKNQESHLCPL